MGVLQAGHATHLVLCIFFSLRPPSYVHPSVSSADRQQIALSLYAKSPKSVLVSPGLSIRVSRPCDKMDGTCTWYVWTSMEILSWWLFETAGVYFYLVDMIMQLTFMHWSTHCSAWRRHISKMLLHLKSMLSRCSYIRNNIWMLLLYLHISSLKSVLNEVYCLLKYWF